MVHVALRGTNSEPYHAQIVYYSRSAWLLPLSARPARLLVLLPGQSGVYKFHHYFSDIKVPTYVFDMFVTQTKESHVCHLRTGETHDQALAGLYALGILLHHGFSGGTKGHNLIGQERTFCWIDFDQ